MRPANTAACLTTAWKWSALRRKQSVRYEAFDETRFILFAKAVVALASADGWSADVIHCNDWHTGLIPQYAQSARCRDALGGTATVFTIHNMAYQGPMTELGETLAGLGDDFKGNLLARGIAFADMVNTVSPRYMKEIQSPAQGEGLDGLIRARAADLRGIINGIDNEEYDPRTDPFIAANYDASSVRRKRESKFELQALSRLRKDASAPLLGMIARLTDQKGYDLLCAGIDEIVALAPGRRYGRRRG